MSAGVMPRGEFLDRAQRTIRRRTGLVFTDPRRSELERGLRHAMERAGTGNPEAYLARLDAESSTLDDLVAEITVGETYFFREPEQFAVVRDHILPDLLAHRGATGPLRVWSAGCASGEEPYSIAMLLREMGQDGTAHILGTDISRAALARARRAHYTQWSLRGVPREAVQTHFTQRGGEFVLDPGLKAAVEFGYLNLAEDAYPSLATGIWGLDLILCRNVLIYFDRDTVVHVARRLFGSLAEGGWLLLGATDPTLMGVVPAEAVVTRSGLAYRRTHHPTRGVTKAPAPPEPAASLPEPISQVAEPPLWEPPAVTVPPAEDAVRCYAERDYLGAAGRAERALAQDGGDPGLWALWVRALANLGDLASAGRACAAGLDRHRTAVELAYLHALLLSEGGRAADAAAAARTALYLDRRLVVAHLALGAALGKVGDASGARRAFGNAERLLSAMPADAVVPASDGEPAGRLAEMVRLRLRLLGPEAQ